MKMIKWKPIIAGKEQIKYLEKISEIANTIVAEAPNVEDIYMMSGKMGLALFLFYCGKLTNQRSYFDLAYQQIDETFDIIQNEEVYFTLANGLAGVGWNIGHCIEEGFLDNDSHDLLADIDKVIYRAMLNDLNQGNYDYLHGAIGHGLYFLNRPMNYAIKKYLNILIDKLDDISIKEGKHYQKWEYILDHDSGLKGFNLSLSHGLASIINFLSLAYINDINKLKAQEMLNGAVNFLLAQKLDTNKYKSNFPSWVVPNEKPNKSGLRWCYGDLGIGVSLWLASKRTKQNELEKTAIDVLLHTSDRRDIKIESVLDGALCHGSAGIAHVFNRMYNYTGNIKFKETAIYWYNETLKMAKFDDGYAGFKAWRTEEYGGYQSEAGLLEGVAGIGLSFISAISDIEPKWDRCFLLS